MKKHWLLAGILLLSPWLCAADNAQVVKIASHLCSKREGLYGSGWVFRFKSQTYVLTSEHVVLHTEGNEGVVCHRVFHPTSGWQPARLKHVDWGGGLAILELHENWPTAQPLKPAAALNHEVVIEGFPFHSMTALRDEQGRILSKKSRRHFIPLVQDMLEVSGAHAEYGMSGAPVFQRNGAGDFVGLLSHQVIVQRFGRESLVASRELESQGTMNLLVIPASDIEPWLRKVLAPERTTRPNFTREINSARILASGLAFSIKPQAARNTTAERPSGEIGGEGAGIGGPSSTPSREITISFAAEAIETEWYEPAKKEWLEKVKVYLIKQSTVTVPFLIEKNPLNGRLQKKSITSISQFFSELRNPAVQAVVNATGPVVGTIEKRTERLVGLAHQLRNEVDTVQSPNLSVQGLLSEVRETAEIAQTEGVWILPSREVHRLIEDSVFEKPWRTLFVEHFDSAVRLRRSLEQMECLLAYTCQENSSGSEVVTSR